MYVLSIHVEFFLLFSTLKYIFSAKMSFDTTWDIDKYRSEHESEEHWNFRRQFIMKYKDRFAEDRLVCLAQIFFNVEFLGCRYV